MKRSVLNLLGGLLLCLPMLFTSCSEKDNSLEQIVNQPNLEGLKKALYKNAEVTVNYTVYKNGAAEPCTVTLKNVGTVEKPKYEIQGEMPDVGYDLTCDMGYEDGKLYFGLVYCKDSDDGDASEDMFDMLPVMVVRFDTGTSKYDVFALPGFSIKDVSINGVDMEVENACDENSQANIEFYHHTPTSTRISAPPTPLWGGLDMVIGLNGINTWKELDDAYDEVGLGVFASINDQDDNPTSINNDMVIDLSDYDFYFGGDDEGYWKVFVIFNDDFTAAQEINDPVTSGTTYKAQDHKDYFFLPCYGLNSRGNIALLDVLTLKLPPTPTSKTWEEIATLNNTLLKLVTTTANKKTVVNMDGVPNSKYYGLYDGKNSTRVVATSLYDPKLNYHLYQLKKSIQEEETGREYTP